MRKDIWDCCAQGFYTIFYCAALNGSQPWPESCLCSRCLIRCLPSKCPEHQLVSGDLALAATEALIYRAASYSRHPSPPFERLSQTATYHGGYSYFGSRKVYIQLAVKPRPNQLTWGIGIALERFSGCFCKARSARYSPLLLGRTMGMWSLKECESRDHDLGTVECSNSTSSSEHSIHRTIHPPPQISRYRFPLLSSLRKFCLPRNLRSSNASNHMLCLGSLPLFSFKMESGLKRKFRSDGPRTWSSLAWFVVQRKCPTTRDRPTWIY